MDVLATAQAEMQHPCANGVVGDLVDQDEAAQRAIFCIGIKDDAPVGRNLANPDLIQIQRLRCEMFHRIDVDFVFWFGDCYADHLRAQFEPVAAADDERLVVHPHDGGFELVSDFGRVVGSGKHIAAGTIDFLFQSDRDGLARNRFVEFPVHGDHRFYRAGLARRERT